MEHDSEALTRGVATVTYELDVTEVGPETFVARFEDGDGSTVELSLPIQDIDILGTGELAPGTILKWEITFEESSTGPRDLESLDVPGTTPSIISSTFEFVPRPTLTQAQIERALEESRANRLARSLRQALRDQASTAE